MLYQSRRGSSVALCWTQCAKTTVQGDRQVYHTITDVRSTIIVLLHFTRPTGVGSLELTAESVRPREKSFIRPISQIANEVGSSNPRMTSEVRKCPKMRFFALFGPDAGRVVKNEPLWKCAQSPSGPTLERANSYIGHITLIFWKNPFFGIFSKKIFTRRYLVSLMTKEGHFYSSTTGWTIRSDQFVRIFSESSVRPATKSKVRNT